METNDNINNELHQNSLLDDNNSEEQKSNNNTNQQGYTITEKLIMLRQEWTAEIERLNNEMKTLPKLNELINVIYSKRQNLVDWYYGTMVVLKRQTRTYTQSYANIYNNLKLNAQIRYTESVLATQVEAQLIDQKAVIDDLKNFTDFVYDTIKTLDNMIYGVNNKIRIHEIMNGLKI